MRDYSGDWRQIDKEMMNTVKQRPINKAFVSDCLVKRMELLKMEVICPQVVNNPVCHPLS